jgi:hypothetical protein
MVVVWFPVVGAPPPSISNGSVPPFPFPNSNGAAPLREFTVIYSYHSWERKTVSQIIIVLVISGLLQMHELVEPTSPPSNNYHTSQLHFLFLLFLN